MRDEIVDEWENGLRVMIVRYQRTKLIQECS